MNRKRVIELCKRFSVPEALYNSELAGLQDNVGYSGIPYVLERGRFDPSGDTIEMWCPCPDGQLHYERWQRGNCSVNYYKDGAWRKPLPFTKENVESLFRQGFKWGIGV